ISRPGRFKKLVNRNITIHQGSRAARASRERPHRPLSLFSTIGSALRPQVDGGAEETGEKIARRVPPTAYVVGAKEHIRRVLLRFERRMERIRREERLPPRRSEGPFDRHGRSTCSVEVRDQVKVRVPVIEV